MREERAPGFSERYQPFLAFDGGIAALEILAPTNFLMQ